MNGLNDTLEEVMGSSQITLFYRFDHRVFYMHI